MTTIKLQEWNTRAQRTVTVTYCPETMRIKRATTAFLKLYPNGMATIISERGGCGITTKSYLVTN